MGMEFPKNRRKADDSYHALTSSAGGVFSFWLPRSMAREGGESDDHHVRIPDCVFWSWPGGSSQAFDEPGHTARSWPGSAGEHALGERRGFAEPWSYRGTFRAARTRLTGPAAVPDDWDSRRVHDLFGILSGSGASLGAGAGARMRGVCGCIRDLVDSGSVWRPLSSAIVR